MGSGNLEGTPIFDEMFARLRAERDARAPFRHAGDVPCYGCQSCLADAYNIDEDDPDEPTEKGAGR